MPGIEPPRDEEAELLRCFGESMEREECWEGRLSRSRIERSSSREGISVSAMKAGSSGRVSWSRLVIISSECKKRAKERSGEEKSSGYNNGDR